MSIVVCAVGMALCAACIFGMGIVGRLFSGRRRARRGEEKS